MSLSGEGQARRPGARRVGVLFVLVWAAMLAVVLMGARPAFAAPSPPGQSALMPSPSTLDFSSQDMHQPSTLPVDFTNTSMTPTTVSQAAIVGQDASSYSIASDSCSQTTIQPGGMCSIYVKFYALPAGPGPKEATLTVTDDNGTNTGTNDVALSGTAITGTLSSDQNTLDFGGLVVDQGNSNQQHVTISDDLSAGVDVSNVQIIGAGASSFYVQNNGCPYNLQRGNTCQIYVQFQPNSAGPQRAQLQIDNDGNTNPLLVSLTGDGLTGPSVTVSPPQAVYGNVALGSQASKRFTLSNDGDAPLQIQAMFLAAGSPQVFPIRDNNCLDRQIAAGNSCRFTVGFIPIAVGDKDGSVFVISNASNPGVTTIGLDGTGASPAAAPTPKPKPTAPAPAPALDGTATIAGAVQAGRRLACTAHSYPPGTRYSYRWLRDGKPIPGALGRRRVLGDADVGTRLACRVTATGPGGSQTVTSRATARTRAQFTVDTTSASGDTITATVTVSRGRLHATGRLTNPSAAFAKRTVTVRTGGTYTLDLTPSPSTDRAVAAGRARHVTVTLVLDATHARRPLRRTFSVIVHGVVPAHH